MKLSPLILLVITLIIVIAPLQCLNNTELTLLTLARPFTYFYAKTPSADTITAEAYQSLKERDKVKFLEQKTNELSSEIILLRNENLSLVNKLKNVSDFRQIAPSGINIKENYHIVLAEVVIKSDVSAWRRSFLVNRGYNDGLQNGFTVVSGKYLVGKISDVGPATCRVQLITDPAFRSQVMILPPPEAVVTTEGSPVKGTPTDLAPPGANPPGNKVDKKNTPERQPSGQACFGVLAGISFNRSIIKWVSRELQVNKDWNVFSAPDPNAITPSGLIVGTVDNVSIDGYFYTLGVNPAIDFYNINSVLILVPKK
ncbi:MAG: rod shape-determining protein MreC [Planctomycetota bacterium]